MSKNLLIIDDDPRVRDTLTVTISRYGYLLRNAQSREDALKMIWVHKPDAILVDEPMNGLGLEDFVREARAVNPSTCIIIMSAAALDPKLVHKLKLCTLLKPIVEQSLRRRLKKCVGGTQQSNNSSRTRLA